MNAAYQGPKDRAPARVGQVLRGKWRLDELLAVGGMASVFAATHRNGKRGAVKLLHYELSLNEESRTRFLREGYVANRVDHEGAVSVLDDDICDDGTVFLVMELLDGQTIDALLRARNTRAFGLGETLRVADRLLDVLAAAHDKGVVHRDIKPENLFITRRGQLKVLDFGIARLREAAMGAGVTRAGDLLGTPSFMSPEQALGNMDVVDARSDLWSVGATMFRLLTGRPVHVAESVNRVLLAAMTMPATPITRILPTIPPQLAAIVDRALAFEQKDRWPDARAMLAAVRAFAHGGGVRIEGSVLATPDEARARPATLALDTSGPPLSGRPLPEVRPPPAAGRPAYTTPPPGVHNPPPPEGAPGAYTSAPQSVHTPPPSQGPPASAAPSVSDPSEQRRRSPAAPVPFASAWSPAPAPLPEAPTPDPGAADSMSVAGLLADADDDEADAKTNVRETIILDTPSPAVAGPRPLAGGYPAPAFGAPPADPSIVPAPLGSPQPGAATNQPPAPPTPSFDTVSPLARADAPGERPITLAPAHTPHFHTATQSQSYSTASPVSRDPTFGIAPRSTRAAPFIVLGAVVVLGGLLAVVLLGDRSSTEGTPPAAAASVLAPATATPTPADTPVVPAPVDPSPPAATSAAPSATADSAPSATASTTATPAAKPATTSPAPKPTSSSTAKRPPGGAPKGDPFSSRKW